MARNVLGGLLVACSLTPRTGFYRDGCCKTGREDLARHVVCAVMDAAFLTFTRDRGNDLVTPRAELDFPGLRPGDRWCLCVHRWQEALAAGLAPAVILEATHEAALDVVSLTELLAHAVSDSVV